MTAGVLVAKLGGKRLAEVPLHDFADDVDVPVAVHGDVLFELAADRLLGVLQPHRCATAYRTCTAGLVLVGCCDGSAEEGIVLLAEVCV